MTQVTGLIVLTSSQSPTFFFFFNDTATTEIYTLSLHDALPIYEDHLRAQVVSASPDAMVTADDIDVLLPQTQCTRCGYSGDRKSTRLNSSHSQISYAVFCLNKKTYLPTPAN